jgi:hypothetical protein
MELGGEVMVTTEAKLKAVKVSLNAHNQGRLSDQELQALAKVIDRTPTSDGDYEEDELN